MIVFAKFIHVVACVALIIIVLLQADKGEGLSGAFGAGGGGAIFGKRGANSFFTKVTAGAAIVFMITSFWLGWKNVPPGPRGPITLPDTSNFPVQ